MAEEVVGVEPGSKTCPLCGGAFGCARGAAGCWCEGITVGRDTLAEIRALTSECICPNCLRGFAADGGSGDREVWAKAVPDSRVRARTLAPLWGAAAVAFLLGSLLLGLAIGPAGIGPGAILGSVLGHLPLIHRPSPLTGVEEVILWQVRAPRVALAALVGAILAVAGSAYQGVFRNPLADPYLLGVAAGAGLGATLAIAYSPGGGYNALGLPLAAFIGASLAVAAAYALGRSAGGLRGTTTLILAGVVIALFMTAVQTFVQQQRSESLRAIYSWLLGGFGDSDWPAVALILPYVALSSVVVLLHRRVLDVLRVGDDEASSLGIDVGRARLTLVAAATLGTAAAVAVSGLIGFVGIIVPHTLRLLVSPSYRAIVPLSLLGGAGFLVLADALARTILSPAELPIGVVTAFFGAPFFALVLRYRRTVVL
jgi:cobalamin transport system permease protein